MPTASTGVLIVQLDVAVGLDLGEVARVGHGRARFHVPGDGDAVRLRLERRYRVHWNQRSEVVPKCVIARASTVS